MQCSDIVECCEVEWIEAQFSDIVIFWSSV